GDQLFGKGSGTAVLRCLLLAAVLSVVWSLIGGWIARAELLPHRAPKEEVEQGPQEGQVHPSLFLRWKASPLAWSLPAILLLIGFCLAPGLVAGLVNQFLGRGIGALVVAVFLPVFMLTTSIAVLLLVGSLSYTIMPAALAAEGSNYWDVLS